MAAVFSARSVSPSPSSSLRVVGIDVGGPAKGFHAIALEGLSLVDRYCTCDAHALARWCRERGARVVAVDAPCRWRGPGLARASERALSALGIACYYAPTEQRAREHPFYRWMLPGSALYAALASAFPLFDGVDVRGPLCFETFPQAIACALAGKIVSAKDKRTVRRALLDRAGLATSTLGSIDEIDATLCALAAQRFAIGDFSAFGDAEDGYIIVPRGLVRSVEGKS